mmetsp:Transcript_23222/g.22789  ORF Transcript_23222/g.22789 Transcript_23222/m.22789 type:complete len:140 (+) Transcript_23222:226-645(+)
MLINFVSMVPKLQVSKVKEEIKSISNQIENLETNLFLGQRMQKKYDMERLMCISKIKERIKYPLQGKNSEKVKGRNDHFKYQKKLQDSNLPDFDQFVKTQYPKVKEQERVKQMQEAYEKFKETDLYYDSYTNGIFPKEL